MTANSVAPRRRIKVRGGPLGWFLYWAVAFADIGTSIWKVDLIPGGDAQPRLLSRILDDPPSSVRRHVKIDPRLHRLPELDPNEELLKAEMAVRQLERAKLSAIILELANPALGRVLQFPHGHLLEVREQLRKSHPAP